MSHGFHVCQNGSLPVLQLARTNLEDCLQPIHKSDGNGIFGCHLRTSEMPVRHAIRAVSSNWES